MQLIKAEQEHAQNTGTFQFYTNKHGKQSVISTSNVIVVHFERYNVNSSAIPDLPKTVSSAEALIFSFLYVTTQV